LASESYPSVFVILNGSNLDSGNSDGVYEDDYPGDVLGMAGGVCIHLYVLFDWMPLVILG